MARTADDVTRLRPERVPPQNLEAEQSVLGAMMLSSEAIADAVEELHPDDFYRSAHRTVYDAIRGIYAHGEPVDVITVTEELKRRGDLDQIGGPLYVRDLVDQVPTPAGAAHYARIVAQSALLRRLISAAADIMELGYSSPDDPEGVADEAEQRIYDVARREDKDQVAHVRDLIDQAMVDLESIQNRDEQFAGVPTGFRDLDSLMSGLQPGNLIVVAARPGVGKSSFVTNLARNVSVDAHAPTAIFSLEMSRWEIGMRLLCGEARVPWDRIRNKRVGAEDWQNIVRAAENLHEAPLSIVDAGNVTIVDIRARARRLATRKSGLGLIIVDYLQLMSSPNRRIDNRQQEIAEISRSLKLLAKELRIPVIAVSQLNRDPERRQDKRPQLSDLRECVTGDTLVQMADGRRVPIEGLVGTTPEVLAMAPDGRIVTARSDRVWRVGRRSVRTVRLASGRAIRCTSKHRLYGADGWVRAGNVSVGDRLAIARTVPEPADPVVWSDEHVALLGQLIGDGSYLSGQPMRYTTASEENSRVVADGARSLGSRVTRYAGRGAWHQLLISGNGNRWYPKGVNAWLRELGIFGQRSHVKRVPGSAFRLSDRQIALLLRHLWATDGCIFVRPPGTRDSHSVSFATASAGLASDVGALLLRLGIVGRIARVRQRGSAWYTVVVSGAEPQRRFLDVVGAVGPRVDVAHRLGLRLGPVQSGTNVDTIPPAVFGLLTEEMEAAGLTPRQVAERRGMSFGGFATGFSPSRTLVKEWSEVLGSSLLQEIASDDLFWDRVVAVDDVLEEQEVFDLTVPGLSSWLADSVISHNSGAIEQDADVVMFIHRDDSDVTTKGTADLIVAKHRNGPTDTIRLAFLPNLTQFRNYAPGP
ncbi:MAG: replicative DNA helicase [Actinomycetota bacterium]